MPNEQVSPTSPPTIAPDISSEDAARLQRIYETVSKNIERENALIHYRITWAILLSAGILAAEGVIVSYVKDQNPEHYAYNCLAQVAIIFLSIVGIFFCTMSGRGVLAAQRQMEVVKISYTAHVEQFKALGFPQPYGEMRDHRIGNYNAFAFPLALTVLWVLFLGAQTYQMSSLWHDKAAFDRQAQLRDARISKPAADIAQAIKDLGPRIDALKPR